MGFSEVTNVTRDAGRLAVLLIVLAACAFAQSPTAPAKGTAESFYLQLRSVGLDKARVFKIRDAALDRGPIHLSFDDGTIAFTQDVEGHVTGALFLGDGDILLRPPNAAERASLALFTGAAILEEDFSLAYLRFNDDVYAELRSSLRPPDDAESFVTLWDSTAKDLAQEDALRLLIGFSDPASSNASRRGPGHLLHAYLRGRRLGTFDVRYDPGLAEQISVGQHQSVDGANYYNSWLSFALDPTGIQTAPLPTSGPDFDITQFKIQAEIKPPTQLSAHADLNITALHGGNRVLVFELSRLLQVQSVTAGGMPVEFIHNQAIEGSQLERRGNDVLAVFLPAPLEAGKSVELTFQYSGAVLSQAASGLLYVGEHGTWYPNTGMKMSRFDLEFKYPPGWTLVATGKPDGTKVEAGEQVSHWTSGREVPVAGFNLGKYSHTVTRVGDVAVETYATSSVEKGLASTANNSVSLPGSLPSGPNTPESTLALPLPPPAPSPSQNVEMVGTKAAHALAFYQQHFGPFPYTQLALAQFPGQVSQGWPGLVFLSSYSFLTPEELARVEPDHTIRLLDEQIIAHEVAHQWWGDLVGWNGYRDQWIMEALANYSALMLLETSNPAEFHQVLRKYRDDLLEKNASGEPLMDAGPVTFGLRLSSSKFPSAYDAISYGRGTWLFHMLRTMLDGPQRKAGVAGKDSDDLFLRALLRLRTEYEGKTLTTAELISAFETELPRSLWYENRKSLDWFLDSWVNGSAVPRFELHDLRFTDKGNSTLVSGTIVQDEAPDTLVTPVPLYASIGGKNVFLGRVFAEGHDTAFHLTAPLHTRKILIDPEQTLLSRNAK